MSRNLFVESTTVRLDLWDGEHWVEVKDVLSWGEQQAVARAAVTGLRIGATGLDEARRKAVAASGDADELAELGIDIGAAQIARIAAYVVDWSFRDKGGRAVPVSVAAIKNLSAETAAELNRVLDAHVLAVEEKKGQTAGTTPGGGSSP